MSKNTSVSLGKHFEEFISSQVEGGRFATASEVLRAGLRLLEEDEARLAALRNAIDEGDASEVVDDMAFTASASVARSSSFESPRPQ